MRLRPTLLGALKSWTIASNVGFAFVAEVLPMLRESVPDLAALLPANEYMHVVAVVAILNIALRFRTRDALSHK
jgi:hypothetical protein